MLNTGLDLLVPVSWLELLGRLGLALTVGGIVGLERQIDHKPAGLRTHMLVSFGSALFVLTGIQTGIVQAEPSTLTRIMQGLIAGIGFLGGGEIFSTLSKKSESVRVQGLTSAAAIWVSAALGTAVGCGLWLMSLVSVTLTVVVLWGIKKLEAYLGQT
jgi:putative Mg2+ transporter-C (MgtC) family protein